MTLIWNMNTMTMRDGNLAIVLVSIIIFRSLLSRLYITHFTLCLWRLCYVTLVRGQMRLSLCEIMSQVIQNLIYACFMIVYLVYATISLYYVRYSYQFSI